LSETVSFSTYLCCLRGFYELLELTSYCGEQAKCMTYDRHKVKIIGGL